MNRKMSLLATTVLLGAALQAGGAAAGADAPKGLTPAEKAAGWKILFDGTSTKKWRGYQGESFPENGWVIEDGCLRVVAGAGGGDIVTTDQYGDFELVLEWRVAEKANSGIMYRVTEEYKAPWHTGPEYQILDDAGYGGAAAASHTAGALYDLYAPPENKVTVPTGEFNNTRIVIRNNQLQHWLNGVKAVECKLAGEEWKKRIADSKFRVYEKFGLQPRGHICLQDHGNDVWFRNIRIRDLDAPMPGEVKLFNGKDFTGLIAFLLEDGKMEDVWTIEDGILICKGKPAGYIRTKADYTNYVLKLQWRFNPVTKEAGNSGVLLRMIGEDKVWPRSIEAQLHSGNAGDFWNIDKFPMKVVEERTSGRNTKKTHFAENPIGEWNEYEIIVDGTDVILKVNGEELNRAWEAMEVPGKICLQSEGAEIQFRSIRLAPIK
ncbi:MAG: DUF1080 domain-containing protein [Phycisphaerales bacterium]|nr:MAG: DUF1080 domain-containing protein [Phycisphaerales bacterium]